LGVDTMRSKLLGLGSGEQAGLRIPLLALDFAMR
jgi:hypothetical protein